MERIPEDIRKGIWDQLKDHQVVYLATVEGDRPRVRPVTMGHYEDRFWLLTGTKDAKTAQVKANPNVEVCLDLKVEGGQGYVRFIGRADVIEDPETKSRVALKFPFFNDFWETPEDPNCTLMGFDFTKIEHLPAGEMWAKQYGM